MQSIAGKQELMC